MTDNTNKDNKKSRRGRRKSPDQERKDRVIQARVPEDLETTLKEAADKQRMSVSHLIRNVLEDTFTLVDNIVADSSALVEQASRDAKRVMSSAKGADKEQAQQLMDSVDAWQEVITNKPGKCVQCSTELKRGSKAFRGLSTEQNSSPIWLCSKCISKL